MFADQSTHRHTQYYNRHWHEEKEEQGEKELRFDKKKLQNAPKISRRVLVISLCVDLTSHRLVYILVDDKKHG